MSITIQDNCDRSIGLFKLAHGEKCKGEPDLIIPGAEVLLNVDQDTQTISYLTTKKMADLLED